ncbi:hypothetical protein CAOG_04877 [Capsaspora owczarzaki ATCC 30864]|uniref:Uncharacterized protein n=1 Tax=Capsaspora owczarzaki (strain ATCC 30864) TaxID=595528 RepID=A0A0D2VSS5_CAPO3|nr:hypothetical protein CAOG_04877 [Capsaspora owczarzaki ATCC 30864]KJE94197.1 hypothetical protein CAOG_004877 [Capsaspora owczarzaki ATCC 30864]|eukprot:XP_004347628.1 hypothetical protein CAOG_04877 [Capsaspora owczarzaki ATCC 30864]
MASDSHSRAKGGLGVSRPATGSNLEAETRRKRRRIDSDDEEPNTQNLAGNLDSAEQSSASMDNTMPVVPATEAGDGATVATSACTPVQSEQPRVGSETEAGSIEQAPSATAAAAAAAGSATPTPVAPSRRSVRQHQQQLMRPDDSADEDDDESNPMRRPSYRRVMATLAPRLHPLPVRARSQDSPDARSKSSREITASSSSRSKSRRQDAVDADDHDDDDDDDETTLQDEHDDEPPSAFGKFYALTSRPVPFSRWDSSSKSQRLYEGLSRRLDAMLLSRATSSNKNNAAGRATRSSHNSSKSAPGKINPATADETTRAPERAVEHEHQQVFVDPASRMVVDDPALLNAEGAYATVQDWIAEYNLTKIQIPDPDATISAASFKEVSDKTTDSARPPFKRPLHYIRHTVDDLDVLSPHSTVCLYDIDAQDEQRIALINSTLQTAWAEAHAAQPTLQPDPHASLTKFTRCAALPEPPRLSTQDFERIFFELEKRTFHEMQRRIVLERNSGVEFNHDIVCDVCLSGDSEDGNNILFCDGCNLAVHQACYGVESVPEGAWFCYPCAHSLTDAKCIFCPNRGGALKPCAPSKITARLRPNGPALAHISCAMWIPEVSFGDADAMEPVESVDNIPRDRWQLPCDTCYQNKQGAPIQCSVKTCMKAFHVTCAQREGLHMEIQDIKSGDISYVAYCRKHTTAIFPDSCKDAKKRDQALDAEAQSTILHRLQHIEKEFWACVTPTQVASLITTIPASSVTPMATVESAEATIVTAPADASDLPQPQPAEVEQSMASSRSGSVDSPMAADAAKPTHPADTPVAEDVAPTLELTPALELATAVYWYWVMKRRARGGAPLLRQFLTQVPKVHSLEATGTASLLTAEELARSGDQIHGTAETHVQLLNVSRSKLRDVKHYLTSAVGMEILMQQQAVILLQGILSSLEPRVATATDVGAAVLSEMQQLLTDATSSLEAIPNRLHLSSASLNALGSATLNSNRDLSSYCWALSRAAANPSPASTNMHSMSGSPAPAATHSMASNTTRGLTSSSHKRSAKAPLSTSARSPLPAGFGSSPSPTIPEFKVPPKELHDADTPPPSDDVRAEMMEMS